MEEELKRLEQAIQIASDPSQGTLHQQALEYLSTIQQNANETWRVALALFTEATPEGARKYSLQARFFALRILDDFLDDRFEPLDEDSFRTLQQSLISYIQSEYVYGSAEASAPFLRNKFSHTFTLLFLCTYMDQWSGVFTDLFTLIRPAESSSQATFNPHVSLLLFHIVLEISGEVADQTLKAARTYNAVRHARDTRVRDAVRERDAARINEALLTIVANSADRVSRLRKGEVAPTSERELTSAEEVVDWGIRTFASYVGWIDINLTVTPNTIPLLFTLLSDPSLPIRLATSTALTKIVVKGLKEPVDKLQLIKVLSLGDVLDTLEARTRAEQKSRGEDTDEGEESYREALGKLLNALGLELMKLMDECPAEEIRLESSQLLEQILPIMLRFMSDEYDDTSSTVFPMLQVVLASYKKARKTASDPIESSKRSFLASLLSVILEKLKWDRETDPDDMDEDDRIAFDGLRKDLRTFMDAVLVIDQDLVTEAIQTLVLNTLGAVQNGAHVEWNDAELAVYLVYIFGEINKTGGKGRAAFCKAPAVAREARKRTDYSEYPLTSHGEMLYALIQSKISAYPNKTVAMQCHESVARYGDFFRVRRECIVPALEAMVDTRGLHSPDSSVRARVFYLIHRFIREDKNEISVELSLSLIQGLRDLLVVQVELPELEEPEQQDMLTEAVNNPGIFDSQLYLFECVGTLASIFYKAPEQQGPILRSIVTPLLDDLSISLQAVKSSQDIVPILRVHHIIMALGNIAKGFPDHPSPEPEGWTPPPLDVFQEVAQAILVSLEAMNVFKVVRDATRFAFARIIGTAGPTVANLIPPLMANLLAHFELSELVDFMNFISLLVHRLQHNMFDVMDQLVGPLSSRITEVLSQPVTGTDDQLAHTDTTRAYLNLLNTIMTSRLHGVFISERNNGGFEALLESMEGVAQDISDTNSEKAAFAFLGRCVSVWGSVPSVTNGISPNDVQTLPGFEQFIYKRLVPAAFHVLSLPELNIKDGQILMVLHEIANFLQTVCKSRGQEAYDYFASVFLPAQGWPPEMAIEFTTKLKDLDGKNFRKYFSDLVRANRGS